MAPELSQSQLQSRAQKLAASFDWRKDVEFVAKVILVLEKIKHEQDKKDILNAGVTDYWLPIPNGHIMPPHVLQETCNEFICNQSDFLSESFQLNQQHWNLDDRAIDRGRRLPKDLIFKEPLAIGKHATVVKVEAAKAFYAIKQFQRKTDYLSAEEQMRDIKQEIRVLKKIDHEHCIRYAGSYTDREFIGVVMDPAADRNLQNYLEKFNHKSNDNCKTLATFFGCLASALEYLHSLNIRHKDIKPANILVKEGNVMFTDFGISLDYSEKGRSTTRQEEKRSPVYCAPEAAKDEPRNTKSDIWPLGCVFLEMVAVLHGRPFTYAQDKMMARCEERNFRNCPEGIKETIAELRTTGKPSMDIPLLWIEKMLQVKRDLRWTSKELRTNILETRGQSDLYFFGMCCREQRQELRRDWPAPLPTDEMDWQESAAPIVPTRHVENTQVHDDGTGEWNPVELIHSSEVSDNWISQSVVDQYSLEMEQSSEPGVLELGGERFESFTRVSGVTFIAGDSSYKRDFWVASAGAPFQLLIPTL